MFVGDETQMPVSAEVAAARLANLIGGGALIHASHVAWGEGVARVGPAGPVPGLSKLVRVHFLEPVRRGAVTVIGLRWEATGPGGGLFPVLDANITLVRHGDQATLLRMEGVYGPPAGATGAGLDRVILHHVAAATMRSFLHRTAAAITQPAPGTTGHPALRPGQLAPETPDRRHPPAAATEAITSRARETCRDLAAGELSAPSGPKQGSATAGPRAGAHACEQVPGVAGRRVGLQA